MAVKKIKVKNFKSFKELEVGLSNLNIIIGANASGKSNFVQVFKFLKDIAFFGLDSAISSQGGIEYLRNIKTDLSKESSFEITYSGEIGNSPAILGLKPDEITIAFSLKAGINIKNGFEITKDELTCKGRFIELGKHEPIKKNEKNVGEILFSKSNDKIKITKISSAGLKINEMEESDKGSYIFQYLDLNNNGKYDPGEPFWIVNSSGQKLLMESESSLITRLKDSIFSDISIFDFDPKLSKKQVPIIGKANLEEDGGNLVTIVKSILSDSEKKRMFNNLLKYLLPYIEDIEVDKSTEMHLKLNIKEEYSDKHYLPAFLISEGTINAISIIIALYFQESSIIIIEEPDRGFHPSLIQRVVEMMKDASKHKQIIVTTHDPEMIKHADSKDVMLIYRDEAGFSSVIRPSKKRDVKTFLKNGLRLEELFIDNLLEI